jgi:squalene-hopene/tetraprenyl-beta-curcumene cyclase
MHFSLRICVTLAGLCFLTIGAKPARSDPPKEKVRAKGSATLEQARKSAERGLAFLEKDAAAWKKQRKCATCHHGTMTVWALSEAKAQGYPVKKETLADSVTWTKERLKGIDKPRDPRPGWKMVNTPALYLALMALTVPKQDALSADEFKQIAGHLFRHQESDGSWSWASAPAQNRPPPVFESDEVATLLASAALAPHVPKGPKAKSEARASREKAAAWLAKTKPTHTTQALLLWLLSDMQAGQPPKKIQERITTILGRQNKDGGWGQVQGLASDAYATGQVLYFLGWAGVKKDRGEIQRAVSFLVAHQKEDGSWPMKSRAHPGAKPSTSPVPITHLGSAWATMGLMRSVAR